MKKRIFTTGSTLLIMVVLILDLLLSPLSSWEVVAELLALTLITMIFIDEMCFLYREYKQTQQL